MQNNMMSVGWSVVNFGNQLISFLSLGAFIAGLVVCILNRRLSTSMTMCIVGFGGEIAVWVLQHLIGALGGLGSIGPEGIMLIAYIGMFINILGPLSAGILVWGLFRVFADVRRQLGLDPDGGKARRRRDEEEEDDERRGRRSRSPGSRDMQR
jgi:hypothetical protein